MRRIASVCLLAGFFLSPSLRSQVDSVVIAADTAIVPSPFDPPASTPKQNEIEGFKPTKSALIAVGLSAALPGAGQLYTANYWKVPVIWGLGGYWVYEWMQNDSRYRDFRDRYAASIQPARPFGVEEYRRVRDFYRDQRDSFAWYIGFLYFLNLVDAYVDAQLYDFEVGPELLLNGMVAPKMKVTVRIGL